MGLLEWLAGGHRLKKKAHRNRSTTASRTTSSAYRSGTPSRRRQRRNSDPYLSMLDPGFHNPRPLWEVQQHMPLAVPIGGMQPLPAQGMHPLPNSGQLPGPQHTGGVGFTRGDNEDDDDEDEDDEDEDDDDEDDEDDDEDDEEYPDSPNTGRPSNNPYSSMQTPGFQAPPQRPQDTLPQQARGGPSSSAPREYQAALALHNQNRASKGLNPLQWDPQLAADAQAHAAALANKDQGMQHANDLPQKGQGENLSQHYAKAAPNSKPDPDKAVEGWLEEEKDYKGIR